MTTIHCFFSGGRDSAVACTIAKKVADVRGWRFKLVFIDTTISIRMTQDYVKRYAEWLNAELVVIRPEQTFAEYATKYGMWPALQPPRFRWCYYKLKLRPTIKYIHENYSKGDLLVLGVRKSESLFRDKFYTSTFIERKYGSVVTKVWLPLLHVDNNMLEKLVDIYGIPRNPVWKFGFSGECLCLAGSAPHKVAMVMRNFPEETQELLSIDDAINKNRRNGKPSAPFLIHKAGFKTLREFYNFVMSQTTLDQYIIPYGKECSGSCML